MFMTTAKEVLMIFVLIICDLIPLFSVDSSDKNKCYEMIKKLSEIYQSDKEYLKVYEFKNLH